MPTMPQEVPLHSWAVTARGGVSSGLNATLAAAKVLTLTALDVLTDDELRTAARADFAPRTERFTYVSPLPAEQTHPVGLPAGVNTDGAASTMIELAKTVAV